ncbi:MAG: hypothetical protein M1528_00795 [Candidatus Marsarchaeota archaeon]|jgi:transposase|nr:hypothetical protein [Candidatus Marsarchaeota archaeon]MCL5115058.1 hypothetical protein [Candidatus Marsarchaeota archaeon]
MERIAIRALELPDSRNPERLLQWFCAVLGLSSDEEGSIEKNILRELVSHAQISEGISSSELTVGSDMARSTVIYHLNRFIEIGVAVKRGRKYYLRANEMSKVIEELEYDIDREMQRIFDIAKEFDRMMETKTKVKRAKKG